MSLLVVKDIGRRISDAFSLKQISFTQAPLQKIAITGETGSGKSTLLRIIAGLLQADYGQVFLNGQRVPGPDEQLIPGHPRIAYLSQQHELRNNYRIEELLEYANRLPQEKADTLYQLCRIDHLLKRKNIQLSGGEKQRVALTRLLVGSPALLLLDEPFSNLDPFHKQLLKSVIANIGQALQITCILTSHDPMDTLGWADEIIILKNGSTWKSGNPETLFHQPGDAYTAGLFGPYMVLPDTVLAMLRAKASADNTFLRPSDLEIAEDGAEGTVTRKQFQGNYEYLTVTLHGTELVVLNPNSRLQPGQAVKIRMK